MPYLSPSTVKDYSQEATWPLAFLLHWVLLFVAADSVQQIVGLADQLGKALGRWPQMRATISHDSFGWILKRGSSNLGRIHYCDSKLVKATYCILKLKRPPALPASPASRFGGISIMIIRIPTMIIAIMVITIIIVPIALVVIIVVCGSRLQQLTLSTATPHRHDFCCQLRVTRGRFLGRFPLPCSGLGRQSRLRNKADIYQHPCLECFSPYSQFSPRKPRTWFLSGCLAGWLGG